MMDRHKEGLQAPSEQQHFFTCHSDQLDTPRILTELTHLGSDTAPVLQTGLLFSDFHTHVYLLAGTNFTYSISVHTWTHTNSCTCTHTKKVILELAEDKLFKNTMTQDGGNAQVLFLHTCKHTHIVINDSIHIHVHTCMSYSTCAFIDVQGCLSEVETLKVQNTQSSIKKVYMLLTPPALLKERWKKLIPLPRHTSSGFRILAEECVVVFWMKRGPSPKGKHKYLPILLFRWLFRVERGSQTRNPGSRKTVLMS